MLNYKPLFSFNTSGPIFTVHSVHIHFVILLMISVGSLESSPVF